jgi:hypothetical protein
MMRHSLRCVVRCGAVAAVGGVAGVTGVADAGVAGAAAIGEVPRTAHAIQLRERLWGISAYDTASALGLQQQGTLDTAPDPSTCTG